MITPFGKELRKIRIDRSLSLRDMAEALDVSSAYLSAVENGKRPITDKTFNAILAYLNTDEATVSALKKARELSARTVTLSLEAANDTAKETLLAFARNFNSLSNEEIARIQQILSSKEPQHR